MRRWNAHDLPLPAEPVMSQEHAPVVDGSSHLPEGFVELSADAFAAALADAFARIQTAALLKACAVACARIEKGR